MPTALESRAALKLLTTSAVATAATLFERTTGTPDQRRYAMLDAVPELIGYYADGAAALAADYYEDVRERANVSRSFVPQMIVNDRVVKIRRAIAWSAEPLFNGTPDLTPGRLAEVVQLESARPFRDTITTNRQQDPEAVGWRRITSGGCNFCQMLASRGAVYSEAHARFASHPHCHCTAEPVFKGQASGPAASVLQYTASKKSRTPEQRKQLREYLASF